MSQRWVCLDIGETLIEETRIWTVWAEVLGVPLMTFMAAFGAAVERGLDHRAVFDILDLPDWRSQHPTVQARYGGLQTVDLYPDAHRAIDGLRAQGYAVAVIGNQPAERTHELRALGIQPEVMAMSGELGVAKPDPAFFARTLELLGGPPAADVAYVGDRPDNDVRPAGAAGMRPVWLRRGPWGHIATPPAEAALTVRSLDELVDRVGELWPSPDDRSGH